MAKTRYKGKLVNVKGRRDYRVNKHNRRTQRRNVDGQLLNTVMRQLWRRQCKQDNRWLRAKVESKDRNGITFSVESELVHWFRIPFKKEQERPKLRPDLRLSVDATRMWKVLKEEWRAAITAQGQKFEAEDWWLEEGTGEEGKKMRMREQMEELTATMAILGVRGQESVAENEEGNFVFLSPEGSVMGEEDNDEGDNQSVCF